MMQIASIAGEAMGFILTSLLVGGIACLLLCSLMRAAHHAPIGPPVVAGAALAALFFGVFRSELLQMALAFAAGWAAVAWIIMGGRPRSGESGKPHLALRRSERPDQKPRETDKYPVLADCIRYQRPPAPHELKRVAARMLRETGMDRDAGISFAGRRAVMRAARVALRGQ